MKSFAYDLHIHSCLSPCADDDMTPANIAGMAHIKGLGIVALTDHNSTANIPAFFECCRYFNILPIAGIELTTAEDIHMVLLFRSQQDALSFGSFVKTKLLPVENKTEIFGNQLIVDSDDNVIDTENLLLINATSLTVDDAISEAKKYNAAVFPAHIDRTSNGMAAILGTIPSEYGFNLIELNSRLNKEECIEKYSIKNAKFLYNSDSHHLWDISEAVNRLSLEEEALGDEKALTNAFFKALGL